MKVGIQFLMKNFFTETQLAEVYRDDEGNVIGGKSTKWS